MLPPLSLYVHIPWCERKCPYCDFNSHEGFNPGVENDYIDALLADLDSQLAWLAGRSLTSVFIGGGTPSLFSAAAIGRLMEGIDQRLPMDRDIEITMESNPGSAEAARYRGYRAAGVNRLSIGVQSFDNELLSRLGRVHDRGQALRAIAWAQDAGFTRFNLDLMHGLPGQSLSMAIADLTLALQHHSGHISWYQLTIEPNTVFYRHPPTLPAEDELAAIQDAGEAIMSEAGLQQYEVSAFAQDEQQSRHNRNYWEFGDYLAIGAGAHGKISDSRGVHRFQRSRVPRDYMQKMHTGPTPALNALDDGLLAGEFMLNALRLKAGVPTGWFTARTGLELDAISGVVAACVGEGLMVNDPSRLATTDLGFRFLNNVVGRFLPD